MGAVIAPTVGRVVWYHPPGADVDMPPLAALIAFVHPDGRINVGGFDHLGKPFNDQDALLLQDESTYPRQQVMSAWCCWMPYQKSQAIKTEAAEQAFATRVAKISSGT